MLDDKQLFDATSSVHHKLEAQLFDLSIGDQQFPESRGVAVHSFSFLFVQEEHMFIMLPMLPEASGIAIPKQQPFAVMVS